MREFIVSCILLLCTLGVDAQDRPQNGAEPSKIDHYIFKNATIYVSPQKVIQKGFIIIENGVIKEVGSGSTKSVNHIEVDCEGQVIMASFIEFFSDLKTPPLNSDLRAYQNRNGAYSWNDAILPERLGSSFQQEDKTESESLCKKGFGLVHNVPTNGIIAGQSYLRSTLSSNTGNVVWKDKTAISFTFDKGSAKQAYPSSQMGAIALLRQTLYDAKWYSNANQKDYNISLEALNEALKGKVVFKGSDAKEVLRAHKIIAEFGLDAFYLGGGDEYKFAEELKNKNVKLILPLAYPQAYNVTDPYVNQYIPLSQLKQWELAPANPSIIQKAQIEFVLSGNGVSSDKEFWTNIRRTINHGLSVENALKALTVTPANWLGISDEVGTLEAGKKAFFTIYSTNPFLEEGLVMAVVNSGKVERINEKVVENLEGKYNFQIENKQFVIEISKKGNNYEAKRIDVANKNLEKVKLSVIQNDIQVAFMDSTDNWNGYFLLHGKFYPKMGVLEGEGTAPNGHWSKWTAIKQKKTTPLESKLVVNHADSIAATTRWYPNMAFGATEKLKQANYVFKNVTVWTNEREGQLKNGVVIVKDGKIAYVGSENTKYPIDAEVIDGAGMFLTSGIIDEHSHIAISKGVNEGGQTVTSEVSIADVVREDDINIYRQLAGGVTTAHLLHGSANTIGGQSALIKLKWGYSPNEMLFKDAPSFIKFALGENVKQTNWNAGAPRFPNTRMGVEQVLIDAFSRAREYQIKKSHKQKDYRVDLELEALVEILENKRFITCHSYIQSEINMLMKVADSFGFKVNTFTHILEGYKVADKMREHGAGASTFADWWAYKFEVLDAIPYNASLMNQQGLVVAINSDDAEMGRRLNQEAAKAIKYGGMSEEDAWKMVTLNPAKLLQIDERVGSIKVGKDADLVLWNANPLSIAAVPELVLIDGIPFFSRSTDIRLQLENEKERSRIISKMIKSNQQTGDKGKVFEYKIPGFFHCNTLGEEGSTEHNEH